MAFVENHWPEEAVICNECKEIIQAGYPIWFDDETGVQICEYCYEKQGEK